MAGQLLLVLLLGGLPPWIPAPPWKTQGDAGVPRRRGHKDNGPCPAVRVPQPRIWKGGRAVPTKHCPDCRPVSNITAVVMIEDVLE